MCTFTKCIIRTDETTIGDAGDLDLVISMYNLKEYSSNYSEKTGSLWFYSKDEELTLMLIFQTTIRLNNYKCKTKLLGNTDAQADNVANGILKNATVVVPL